MTRPTNRRQEEAGPPFLGPCVCNVYLIYTWNQFAVIHILDVMQIWYPRNEFLMAFYVWCFINVLHVFTFGILLLCLEDVMAKTQGPFLEKGDQTFDLKFKKCGD